MEHRWFSIDKCIPAMRVKKPLEEGGRDYLESDYVLVWDGSKVEIAKAIFEDGELYWMDRYVEVVKAVYWMPMPTPPEVK
jgi:hypothetical protein